MAYPTPMYRDPAEQLERIERAFFRGRMQCTACERRPAQVGGDGNCKEPRGGCERFSLDVHVVRRRAADFGIEIKNEQAHRLLLMAGAGGSY